MIAGPEIEIMALNVLASMATRTAEDVRRIVRSLASTLSQEGAAQLDQLVEDISRRIEVKLEITMEDAAVIQVLFEPWLEGRRSEVEFKLWNRYRRLLGNKLPPKVLGTIDRDTDRIVGLLENPIRKGPWKRRGMAVGEVQSGKTGNYIGVACKAADFGYKFIVLLAGMQNNLRRQTQERVEDGFIGLETDKLGVGGSRSKDKPWTGVGIIDSSIQPIALTTRTRDFKNETAVSANISFDSVKAPIILVVKKQKRVLENLIAWLRANNRATGGVICGVPMLLLDDEADNASINTKSENDPTQINRLIRELLNQFEQNAYLGYTATPFANIFIDPDTNTQMLQEDLFPRDFMVALDAPTNYMGAGKVFLGEEDNPGMVRDVEDHRDVFPEKHKIDHEVDHLPETLLGAIRCFVLARAVRMLRGQSNAHNSMLVNVSRFNGVQRQVTALIQNYLTTIRNAVQAYAALPASQALSDQTIASLRDTWESEFPSSQTSWDQVQAILNQAVGPIVVRTINNKSTDALDYLNRKDEGLNVIAVGGLSLSRGFTLEGLTVSYFIRNSVMYDTLLQMGRWFGYRDGYDDLCRLFMTPDASSWYRHIAAASEELRDEIRRMEREGRTPADFGLKVRAHPDSLIVTARNKMKTGITVPVSVSLKGELIETVYIRKDSLAANRKVMTDLVSLLSGAPEFKEEKGRQGFLWTNVDSSLVKDFIRRWRNHERNPWTQSNPLIDFISGHEGTILGSWDICLYDPDNEKDPFPIGPKDIHPAVRKADRIGDGYQVSGRSSRVASRGSEKVGLSDEEIELARAEFRKTHKSPNISDRYFRLVRDRPLLMLHVLTLDHEKNWVPAWGISFPGSLPDGETVEYVVNTTWFREQAEDEVDDDSIEEVTDEA